MEERLKEKYGEQIIEMAIDAAINIIKIKSKENKINLEDALIEILNQKYLKNVFFTIKEQKEFYKIGFNKLINK